METASHLRIPSACLRLVPTNPVTSEGVIARCGGLENQAITELLTSPCEYTWQTVPFPWISRSTLYRASPAKGERGEELASFRPTLKVPGGCGQATDVFLERRDGSGASLSILAYDGMEPPSNGIPVVLHGALGAQPPNTSAQGSQLPL